MAYIIPSLKALLDRIEKVRNTYLAAGYELDLMWSTLERTPGTIYLGETEDGLQYEVIGLDKKIINNTIPWDALPKDFPRKLPNIMGSRDKCLTIILDHTAKAGHTQAPNPVRAELLDILDATSRLIEQLASSEQADKLELQEACLGLTILSQHIS